MCRYGGYSLAMLDELMEGGLATYDEAADTYTITCSGPPHEDYCIALSTGCPGRFVVGVSPEFA